MSDIGFTVFQVDTRRLRSNPKRDETARTPLSRWTAGHRINTMNLKDYAITTCDDPIRCPKPWTPVDSGYVMHEIGMPQNCRQPTNRRPQDPLRQLALPNRQNVSISRELDPCPPTHLAGHRHQAKGDRFLGILDTGLYDCIRQARRCS